MNETLKKMDELLDEVNYCNKFEDTIAECRRKIAEHAVNSIKNESEFDRDFYHRRMVTYVKVLDILKQNE